ncbi:ubiquitin carboxyl-terminal hydrolase 15 [Pelomyxa schiedti]|nr:ubiquitin carboxyl-terminal hydrolase 15 [Pelomyxa schiedti]
MSSVAKLKEDSSTCAVTSTKISETVESAAAGKPHGKKKVKNVDGAGRRNLLSSSVDATAANRRRRLNSDSDDPGEEPLLEPSVAAKSGKVPASPVSRPPPPKEPTPKESTLSETATTAPRNVGHTDVDDGAGYIEEQADASLLPLDGDSDFDTDSEGNRSDVGSTDSANVAAFTSFGDDNDIDYGIGESATGFGFGVKRPQLNQPSFMQFLPPPPPPNDVQRDKIGSILVGGAVQASQHPRVGDKWFVLSAKWYNAFCARVALSTPVPMPAIQTPPKKVPTKSKPSREKGKPKHYYDKISTDKSSGGSASGEKSDITAKGLPPESSSSMGSALESPSASATSSSVSGHPPIYREVPGEIDNTDITLDDFKTSAMLDHKYGPQLKETLTPNQEYLLIPSSIWDLFLSWYGGGPPIARWVIEEEGKTPFVELFPLFISVFKMDQNGQVQDTAVAQFAVSKTFSFLDLKKQAATALGVKVDLDMMRLWSLVSKDTLKYIQREAPTLAQAGVGSGDSFVLEVMHADMTWIRNVNPKSRSIVNFFSGLFKLSPKDTFPPLPPIPTSSQMSPTATDTGSQSSSGTPTHSTTSPGESESSTAAHSSKTSNPGLCGLNNLGNTCYMNAALQCLSNTPMLTTYFVSGSYKNDLTTNNSLGMDGQIAEQYAGLMNILWSGKYEMVAPRELKTTIGKYAKQFNGYNQHDAHELISFLLDGLHEDLNRTTKKSKLEPTSTWAALCEDKRALEAWRSHLTRNDSIIVDIFQGLFKSTLKCPSCPASVTFDPFMYLSLPIPGEKERAIEVLTLQSHTKLPITQRSVPYPVKRIYIVPTDGHIRDIQEQMQPECPQLVLLFTHTSPVRITHPLPPSASLGEIPDGTLLIASEIPSSREVKVIVSLVNRVPGFTMSPKGYPFHILINMNTTGEQLYKRVWQRVKKFTIPMEGYSTTQIQPEFTADELDPDDCDNDSIYSDQSDDTEKRSTGSSTKPSGTPAPIPTDSKSHRKYPFRLCYVRSNCTSCGYCSDYRCHGCPIRRSECPAQFASPIPLPLAAGPLANVMLLDVCVDWQEGVGEIVSSNLLYHKDPPVKKRVETSPITIFDCFKLFTTPEQLSTDENWICDHCKHHSQAVKQIEILKIPEVLVIHLKRFIFTKMYRQKIEVNVDFPDTLDLAPFALPQREPVMYELYGIVNHHGGLGGGHYTAFARNKDDMNWYKFDDSNYNFASPDELVSPAAYILFYKRKPIPAPAPTSTSTPAPTSTSTSTRKTSTPTSSH